MPPAAMLLEATVQQQHSFVFRVAYEGVQPLFAERAYAIYVCSVLVSDAELRLLSDIQHIWGLGVEG